MDDIETAILDAWFDRVFPILQRDPRELARRLARRRSATLNRPPRPWCVALRANDARLTPSNPQSEIRDPQSSPHPSIPSSPHDPPPTTPDPQRLTLTRAA